MTLRRTVMLATTYGAVLARVRAMPHGPARATVALQHGHARRSANMRHTA
jgi:hypothetical protein